jgi:arsenite methyltransferase
MLLHQIERRLFEVERPERAAPSALEVLHPAAWAGCVSGALAEGDFARKLERAGFTEIAVRHREPMSVDDCALYPLFTDDLIELMRSLIPSDQQRAVATSIVVTARLPAKAG